MIAYNNSNGPTDQITERFFRAENLTLFKSLIKKNRDEKRKLFIKIPIDYITLIIDMSKLSLHDINGMF